jgi:hypothetical protein
MAVVAVVVVQVVVVAVVTAGVVPAFWFPCAEQLSVGDTSRQDLNYDGFRFRRQADEPPRCLFVWHEYRADRVYFGLR